MIFHSPSTFSNVNKSVYRPPVQLSSSSRTVATVSMRSMLATRETASASSSDASSRVSVTPEVGQTAAAHRGLQLASVLSSCARKRSRLTDPRGARWDAAQEVPLDAQVAIPVHDAVLQWITLTAHDD